MSQSADQIPPDNSQAILEQNYLIAGLIAIVGVGVSLVEITSVQFGILPAVIGFVGLLFRWRLVNMTVLLTVAFALVVPAMVGQSFGFRRAEPTGMIFLLCLSVLVFLLANHRLLAFSPRGSQSRAKALAEMPERSALGPESVWEIPRAMLLASAVVALVFAAWQLTEWIDPIWNIRRRDWRIGLLIWSWAMALITVAAGLGYWSWRCRNRKVAELLLRDEHWRWTRGEQRRLTRWRVYGSRMFQRKDRS